MATPIFGNPVISSGHFRRLETIIEETEEEIDEADDHFCVYQSTQSEDFSDATRNREEVVPSITHSMVENHSHQQPVTLMEGICVSSLWDRHKMVEHQIADVNSKLENFERQTHRLKCRQKIRAKRVQRMSHVLDLMELLKNRPDLSEMVAAYLRKFFYFLCVHVDYKFTSADIPKSQSFVQHLQHQESCNREAKKERVRFCHQYGISLDVYSVLLDLNDIFCNSFPSGKTDFIPTSVNEMQQFLNEVSNAVKDESALKPLKLAITAVCKESNLTDSAA